MTVYELIKELNRFPAGAEIEIFVDGIEWKKFECLTAEVKYLESEYHMNRFEPAKTITIRCELNSFAPIQKTKRKAKVKK